MSKRTPPSRPAAGAAHGRPAALLALVSGLAVAAAPAAGQQGKTPPPSPPAEAQRPPEPPKDRPEPGAADATEPPPAPATDGARHLITAFEIQFARTNPNLPPAAEVLEATVRLGKLDDGYVAPREGLPTIEFRLDAIPTLALQSFYDSALPLLAPAVVQRMQQLGFIGIYVEPDPDQITVVGGRVVDLRPPGQTSLRLRVTTGVVTSVRSIASGDWLPEGERVDNPIHARIRDRSPVQPRQSGTDRPDLLRRDLIDDYVYRLNRHPGRRVDVAVAPTGTEYAGVTLDYLVSENRPWFLYAQLANDGTSNTNSLRERFGFVHNQLTNNDDILYLDYLTAGFDSVNAVTASYDSPFGHSERWRWRVYGNWSEYTASDVGEPNADFKGKSWSAGGEAVWNFAQHKDLFIDAVAGARWQYVRVDDQFINQTGSSNFFLPYFGARLERTRENERTLASATFEFNAPDIADTNSAELNNLGRLDVASGWTVLLFDVSHSFYLEPLFDPEISPTSTLAHEVYLSARGQYAFGSRLVPNFEQVAGGLYTVRGYPEAIAAGDDVFLATAEYRFHIPHALPTDATPGDLFGRPFRYAPQFPYGPTDWDLILRGFIDFGRTVNNDRLPFEVNQTLVGAGVGLELSLTRHFNARVDWGFALNGLDNGVGGTLVSAGSNRVQFVLTIVF